MTVSNRPQKPLSFVGGIGYPSDSRFFTTGGRIDWPFGRLIVGPKEVTFTPRGLLKKVRSPVSVLAEDVIRVEHTSPRIARFAEALIFRSVSKQWDGMTFATWRSRTPALIEALRKAGIEVE